MPMLFFGGGLNETDDLNIDIEECFEGQNFQLNGRSKAFEPRLPFDLQATLPNLAAVDSLMQIIDRSDVDGYLAVGGGTVYRWNGATVFSDIATVATGSRLRDAYWSLDDKLVITDLDLKEKIQQYDGTTFQRNGVGLGEGVSKTVASLTRSGGVATATVTGHGYSTGDLVQITGANETEYNIEAIITVTGSDTFTYSVATTAGTPATGTINAERSVDLYAKYAITWNNRVWLFNIKDINKATTTTSLNPHMILASTYENSNDFDTAQNVTAGGTGLEAFFMLTPDLKPINGAVAFYDTMIISTENGRLFKITGSDSTDYAIQEYFPGSAAGGEENMVYSGNDIFLMRSDGGIDSVGSVEQYGDIKADDISRFIETTTNGMSSCISTYDQQRQKIYMFVPGSNKVLVLDKQQQSFRPNLSPWTVYATTHTDNYNTRAVRYMRDPDTTTWDVYFGGPTGAIYKMNGTPGGLDGGTATITANRRTRGMYELPTRYRNITGRMEYRRRDAVPVTLQFDWGEELKQTSCLVNLKARTDASPYWGGDVYWGGDFYFNDTDSDLGEDLVSTVGFSPAGKGTQFFLKMEVTNQGDFYISRIVI